MELTANEITLIMERRAEEGARNTAKEFQRKAINTANAFAEWSDTTGYGLTFSTFVNQFDYQDNDGKQMYEAVQRIQQAAMPQ